MQPQCTLAGIPDAAAKPFAATNTNWATIIYAGLEEFIKLCPEDSSAATMYTVLGPCIEGVGEYVDHNVDLQVPHNGSCIIDVIGDATGTSRGLGAAFITGSHTARRIIEANTATHNLELEIQQRAEDVRVTTLNKLCNYSPVVELPPYPRKMDPEYQLHGQMYELHVFFLPLNPDDATIAKYKAAVQLWNDIMGPVSGSTFKPMKSPVLALKFGDKYVTVMQCAMYSRCKDSVKATGEIIRFFRSQGFEDVRAKNEISAHGVEGLPSTYQQACTWLVEGKKYAENHLRVYLKKNGRELGREPTEAERQNLEQVVLKLQSLVGEASVGAPKGIPLAFSYNKGGTQWFINARWRGMTNDAIAATIRRLKQAIAEHSEWECGISIDEWVVYDAGKDARGVYQLGTGTQMDCGWIDPQPTILVIAGKSHVGKTDFTQSLKSTARHMGFQCESVSLAEPLKELFMDMIDHPYKSFTGIIKDHPDYRGILSHIYKAEFAQKDWIGAKDMRDDRAYLDPAFDAAKAFFAKTKGIFIMNNLRMHNDIRLMKKFAEQNNFKIAFVRLNATDEVRSSRGWVPNTEYDNDIGEIGLDWYKFWDVVVQNNGTTEDLQAEAVALAQRVMFIH